MTLGGRSLADLGRRKVASELGFLAQSRPRGITVGDLVSRGRYPHQGWFRRWTPADEAPVARAFDATDTADLVDRRVHQLSGGQRRRVWVAIALARETDLLLLDEPTTYLDINHQVELLRLLRRLNAQSGKTIVVVLTSSTSRAASDHVIAMHEGRILAEGPPSDVITARLVELVFGMQCVIVADPVAGTPLVVPA